MKIFSAAVRIKLWFLLFCFSVLAQDFQKVADGIEHAKIIHKLGSEPVSINLLRLDLTKVRLDVAHAFDRAIGLEKTSSMAARHGAFAAVNAGFFRLDTSIFAGDAVGILKIDGGLLSEPFNNRIALFIFNHPDRTEVKFAHLNLSDEIRINSHNFKVSGTNRERKAGEIVVFTPEFNRTTLTDSGGVEIVVRKNRITQVINGKGSSLIPPDGYVISASGAQREALLEKAKIGARVSRDTFSSNTINASPSTSGIVDSNVFEDNFARAEDITNGIPQLIKDGKIDITWEQEKAGRAFVETRHPRTAAAKLKNGRFLLVTVDGRQPGVSVGMSLPELAQFLLAQGATDAINLDGGGSTTMYLDGKVVNQPSDKEGERRVGDAILVFPRRKN